MKIDRVDLKIFLLSCFLCTFLVLLIATLRYFYDGVFAFGIFTGMGTLLNLYVILDISEKLLDSLYSGKQKEK